MNVPVEIWVENWSYLPNGEAETRAVGMPSLIQFDWARYAREPTARSSRLRN